MKIAFWGNFGTQNFGNECTLAAIVQNVRRRLPDAELACVCVVPADTAGRHHIEAIPMWEQSDGAHPADTPGFARILHGILQQADGWRRALRECRRLDALIIPGTGVLNDVHQGLLGFPYQLFKWVLATRLRGGKVFIVSIGVESITHPLARFFVRSALQLAQHRSFRDSRSVDLIRSVGFHGASSVFPDLAFSLPPPAPDRGSTGRVVAVGVYHFLSRGRDGGAASAAYEQYVDRISSFILWLIEHAHTVRLIIGDMSYDMGVRADVRARLQERGLDLAVPALIDEPASSFEQIMEQLRAVDIVIASRFHNILLAMFLGKPVVSLSYEGKIEALMRDMGVGEYCQRLEELDLDRLFAQFTQIEQNAPVVRRTILERARVHREELDRQYELIVTSLRARDGSPGASGDAASAQGLEVGRR